MLAARPKVEPRRRPWADSVVVSEIYVSLQGESSHTGRLCTFIRLTGCHLRCRWCDSEFSFRGGTRRPIPSVLDEVSRLGSPVVEVTGGEPLLQPGVYPLLEGLLERGHEVLLETSGAIDVRHVPEGVRKIVDFKLLSSGESDRNDPRILERLGPGDELKFVVGDRADYEQARALIAEHGLGERPLELLFSTVFGALEPRQLAEWMISDRSPGRLQLQLHKLLWDPDARGT